MFFYFWAQFKAPISIYFWHKQHCILFNLFDCTHRNEWFVIYCHRCYFVCSLLSESVENIFLFFSLYCHSNGFEMIINHICTYQKRNKKKKQQNIILDAGKSSIIECRIIFGVISLFYYYFVNFYSFNFFELFSFARFYCQWFRTLNWYTSLILFNKVPTCILFSIFFDFDWSKISAFNWLLLLCF